MPSAKRTITIRRPPADVFAYVSDGLNGPKWRSGVLDISLVSGEGVGAVYRQGVRGPGGRRIAADYRVTAFEPNHRLAFEAIAGPVRPIGEYNLQETPEGTALTFSLDDPLSGLKRFVFSRPVQQTMDAEMKALDRLKELLEG
jgi:uncharacterized protein YndB with AHSA1/START domain